MKQKNSKKKKKEQNFTFRVQSLNTKNEKLTLQHLKCICFRAVSCVFTVGLSSKRSVQCRWSVQKGD